MLQNPHTPNKDSKNSLLQFLVDVFPRGTYLFGMNPIINFVELENRVISARYRHLMIKAKVVLVDKTSGEQLADPVTTIASPVPSGLLRIRLPDSIKSGTYYLKALNGHGQHAAQSLEFDVS
jgi:hypothetical protein